MVQKIQLDEIAGVIDEDTIAICIVQNAQNKSEAVMYVSDEDMTFPYGIDYCFETLSAIKNAVTEDVLVFVFTDAELTDAWKTSYTLGGIEEDRWDRRTIFHPFNEPNELFCIDRITVMQLRDECESANWKTYMIDWYKNQSI